MPKYNPTPDDLYSTKPCFICGREVIDENEDTCCELCRQQKQIFHDDWEHFLWSSYNDDDYPHGSDCDEESED